MTLPESTTSGAARPQKGRLIAYSLVVAIVVMIAPVLLFDWRASPIPPLVSTDAPTGPRNEGQVTPFATNAAAERFAGAGSGGITHDDVAALRAKAQRVKELALERSGLSDEERRRLRSDIYASFYDPDGAAAYRQELHAQLVEIFGAEEADFRLSIIDAAGDWSAIKGLVEARELQLGATGRYNELLLEAGLGSGKITANEIATLVHAGTELPQEAIFQIAGQGNVETIAQLSDRGLLIDPNYEHPTLSMNAIGAYVRHASAYPQGLDPAEARESVLKLIGVGVNPVSTNGTFDSLDYALQNANNTNLKIKVAIIGALLEQGIRPQESHYEALQLIANKQVREELDKLLRGHSG